MKRLLVCLLSLCMTISVFPTAALADEATDDEIHNYEKTGEEGATCTEEGVEYYTCTTCGDTKEVAIPALGHEPNNEYDDDDEYKEPTCNDPGHEQYEHCKNCGGLIKQNKDNPDDQTWYGQITSEGVLVNEGGRDLDKSDFEIPATGHKYETVSAQEPTCEDDGWNEYVACTVCGEEKPGHKKVTIDATGHTPIPDPTDTDYQNISCGDTEPKSVAAICAVCGKTLEEKILVPIPDHTWKTVEAQDPTCIKDGWEEYEECEVCGAINTEDGEIPYIDALGHDFSVWVGATAGDCTHPGHIAGYKCSRCDESDPDHGYEVIPAPGHNFVEIPEVSATCKEPGVKAYYKCSVCGELFETDDDIFTEDNITDLNAWKSEGGNGYIEPLDHVFKTVTGKKATCTEEGLGAHKECVLCGYIVYTNPNADGEKVIPAHGHSNEDGYWPENYEDNNGVIHVGGDSDTRFIKDLIAADTEWNDPANEGITYCIDPADAAKAKPATCTEDGYQPAKLCLFCGEELEESKVLPATGHDWKLKEAGTLPTCVLPGLSDLWECTVCGEEIGGDPIQPLGHDMKSVEFLLPNCDEDGHFAYSYCTVCGYAEADKQDMIDDRLPENMQKVASLTEKTVSEMPEEGHPAAFVVPKYEHKFTEDVRPVKPTCTEPGIAEGATRCLICEDKYFNLVALNALGHDKADIAGTEAKCLEPGNEAYVYCTRCGKAVAGTKETVKDDDVTNSAILQNLKDTTEIPTEFIIAALGHDEKPGVMVPATCTTAGSTAGTYCARCGVTLIGSTEIPAHGHSNEDGYWPEGYENAEKERNITTLIENGTEWDTYFSEDYSESGIYENITYKVTKEESAKAKVPTCTDAGYDPEKLCIFCDKVLDPAEDIKPLGHKAGSVQEPVAPDCENWGYFGGVHCENCTYDLSYDAIVQYLKEKNYTALEADGWIIIPKLLEPLDHEDREEVPYKGANCTDAGNVAYVYCEICGKAAAGTLATVIPDDLTNSLTYQNLDNLKEIPAEFVIEPLGHDWIDVPGGEKTEATCVLAGTNGVQYCTRCEQTEAVVVPALGHEVVFVDAKAPTCVDEGNSAYVYCTRCNNAVSYDDYEADVTSLDNSVLTPAGFVISATGLHSWVHLDALRATCEEDGHTEGQFCSVCGLLNCTVIPADADAYHAFLSTEEELAKLEWEVANPGDGTPGSGMRVKKCPECGYILAVEEWPNVLKGDVNMDGKVTPQDAQMVLQYYVGILNTLPNMKSADFDEDGEITPKDAQAILNVYLGF